jgi:hypothetical protein
VETLQRTGHLDPAAFWALSPEWQDLHLAHTRHLFTGHYDPPAAGEKVAPSPSPAHAAAEVARWRERREREGPSPADVAQARALLEMPGLPESLLAAARDTLTAAQEHAHVQPR